LFRVKSILTRNSRNSTFASILYQRSKKYFVRNETNPIVAKKMFIQNTHRTRWKSHRIPRRRLTSKKCSKTDLVEDNPGAKKKVMLS
jgi:hypothetical protein